MGQRCNTLMSRNKNLWIGVCPGDASWTWRKLLKLREKIAPYIQYNVGNGNYTLFWVDMWHPLGSLILNWSICEAWGFDKRINYVVMPGVRPL